MTIKIPTQDGWRKMWKGFEKQKPPLRDHIGGVSSRDIWYRSREAQGTSHGCREPILGSMVCRKHEVPNGAFSLHRQFAVPQICIMTRCLSEYHNDRPSMYALAPPKLGYQNRLLCMVGFQSIG